MSVTWVAASSDHDFTKSVVPEIILVENRGVVGDCHYGETVQHRSRMKLRPVPKNLRQAHLISRESLTQRHLPPGAIGENIATEGLDLLAMSTGTRLTFVSGDRQERQGAVVVLTGTRNPCPQIEKYRKGLQETFIVRDEDRRIVRRLAGVMGVVVSGGRVCEGTTIIVDEPEEHSELSPV